MTPETIRLWNEELDRNPDSLAFLRLAEALRCRRDLEEARAVALRGLSRHPYLADAHDVLARVCVDAGDPARAQEEWEMAVRIEPRHLHALKGLGFLAFQRRDLAGAERYLRAALALDSADVGVMKAHQRVLDELAAPALPARAPNDVVVRIPGQPGHDLFATILGDGDRTALLVDRDGLVVAGMYVDGDGRDLGDEVAAELSGVSEEATRALEHLSLGPWSALLVEAQHATVGLAPVSDGSVVLVAAARDTHVGFVRRLLALARERARYWLEGAA